MSCICRKGLIICIILWLYFLWMNLVSKSVCWLSHTFYPLYLRLLVKIGLNSRYINWFPDSKRSQCTQDGTVSSAVTIMHIIHATHVLMLVISKMKPYSDIQIIPCTFKGHTFMHIMCKSEFETKCKYILNCYSSI